MKIFDKELPKLLRQTLSDCRPHLMRVALFSALVNLLYLAPTIYMMQVYDRVVPTGGIGTLFWLTVILAAAIGTLTLLDSARARLMTRASLQVNSSMAGAVLDRILQARSINNKSPEAPRALRELDTLRQSMTGPGIMALFDAPWLPIYLLAAFGLHPVLGILICIGGVVLVVLAVINERAVRKGNENSHRELASAHAAYEALTSKTETIRALGMRRALVSRHQRQRTASLVTSVETQLSATRYTAMVKFVRMFLQSLALGAGAWLAVKGEISSGAIIAASVLLSRALQPIEQLVAAWPSLIHARQSIKSLAELFDGAEAEEREYFLMPEPMGNLELSNVTLRNEDSTSFIVRGISISLSPGKIVGLIGPSGAGKSTIARIAAGAISCDIGDVRVDSGSYEDWDQELLARHIGYLPQDYSLIPGTVAENISRFSSNGTQNADLIAKQIVDAATLAGVHEMILRLPKGYETVVGVANGFALSGGQTQRIALARALFGQPKILVFDEPSAALDADGELHLMRAVEAAKQWGAAILLVAHRSFVLSNADWLVVINGGVIERQGLRQEIVESLQTEAQRQNVVVMKREAAVNE